MTIKMIGAGYGRNGTLSLKQALEKLGRLEEAAQHLGAALGIFRRTVGDESPLTANAMGILGGMRAQQGGARRAEALELLSSTRGFYRAMKAAYDGAIEARIAVLEGHTQAAEWGRSVGGGVEVGVGRPEE